MRKDYKKYNDTELLGKIVSEDVANKLINEHHDLENILLKSYSEELKNIKVIDNKSTDRLKAIGEVIQRILAKKRREKKIITNPEDVFILNRDMVFLDQEEIRVVLLNIKNRVIRVETVAVGTISSAIITPREIYARGVRAMAASIIMVHNHPSGNPKPSQDDKKITKMMIKAGRALNINLSDHVIIGDNCFYSLREECNLDWT